MFKHSSSRHQRSKVLKLKHALQICVLVAVCVWLLYQVKRSHEKKELESNSISELNAESNPMIYGINRKVFPDAKVGSDGSNDNSEDKEIEEAEEGEHEEKKADGEEGSKESEDDDADENDGEKGEEGQQDEELGDDEENEAKTEEKALLESTNNNDDEEEKSTREAREEQYKGDDASSAVVRESEEERHDVGDENEEHKQDAEVKGDEFSGEEDSLKADDSGVDPQKVDDSSSTQKEDDAHISNDIPVNETHPVEGSSITDGSLLNSTIPELSEKSEELFNSTLETASNHAVDGDEKATMDNSTFANVPNDALHLSEDISTTTLEVVADNSSSGNETTSMVMEGGLNSTATTETGVDDKLPELGDDSRATLVNQVTELNEKAENTTDLSGGSEDASHDSSSSGAAGESAHDESGGSAKADAITEEEKDARTDLSTLAEMQLDGTRSIEEIAAD